MAGAKDKCKYGENCYRKDPNHLKAFSHPGDKERNSSSENSRSIEGKKVVFTGVLRHGTRPQVETTARTYGCIPTSAVSSKTDYIIVGEGSGSKESIAKTYGVKTLSEDEWEALLSKCKPSGKASAAPSTPAGTKVTADASKETTQSAGDSDTDVEMQVESEVKKVPQKRKIPKVHSMSASEDESGVPVKKAKKVEPKAAAASDSASTSGEGRRPGLKRQNTRGKKQKCMFWDHCFRRDADHKERYLHPGEEVDEVGPEPRHKMDDGYSLDVKAGKDSYSLHRKGDVYQCSCIGWKTQSKPDNKRTCKHLKDWLSEEFESHRVGDSKAAGGNSKPAGRIPGGTGDNKPRIYRPKHKNIGQLLLAHKWTEELSPKGWWLSEKLDGVRAFWDGKTFYSRLGNEFIAPSWFTKGLPADMELDGELFGGRGKFQTTVSIVKSPECDDWKKLTYQVFDSPSMGHLPCENRFDALKEHFDRNKVTYVTVLDQEKCTGVDHLYEELKRIEGMGGEGVMLRQPGSKYTHGRSKTLLKLKSFHDAEAVVVGYEPGKTNPTITGSLRCKMENGRLFNVGSGLSDKERRKPPKKGSIITYRFQEYTNSGSPRFPTYVGVRIDASGPKDVILPKKGD